MASNPRTPKSDKSEERQSSNSASRQAERAAIAKRIADETVRSDSRALEVSSQMVYRPS